MQFNQSLLISLSLKKSLFFSLSLQEKFFLLSHQILLLTNESLLFSSKLLLLWSCLKKILLKAINWVILLLMMNLYVRIYGGCSKNVNVRLLHCIVYHWNKHTCRIVSYSVWSWIFTHLEITVKMGCWTNGNSKIFECLTNLIGKSLGLCSIHGVDHILFSLE